MTEAEILHQLRPGAWIGSAQRKALERMLAQAQGCRPADIPVRNRRFRLQIRRRRVVTVIKIG